MVLVTVNKTNRLLLVTYIGVVSPEDLDNHRPEMEAMLVDLPPNFRFITDLTPLESMLPGCETVIGKMMEFVDRHGVEMVVRIIPDETKDIGMNILTIFHYSKRPRVATCANFAEAARILGL